MDLLFVQLWPAAMIAAMVYWGTFATRAEPGLAGAAVKTASTGLLAVSLWWGATNSFWPVALGLTLGALGDWFLARSGEAAFLAGMAAFGAGHLAYAGGWLHRSSQIGFDGLNAGEIASLVLLAMLVASTEAWLAPRTGNLRWPVRAYVALIGLMGVAAVLLPGNSGQTELRAGAVLFLGSDLMLALQMFVVSSDPRKRLLSLLLWPAYWLGQLLIGWGALLYWAYPKG